jgi:hypothetical protein
MIRNRASPGNAAPEKSIMRSQKQPLQGKLAEFTVL